MLTFTDVMIPLNRPEYISYPEGFLSALAWSAFKVEKSPVASAGKKLGLRFHVVLETKNTGNIEIHETEPKAGLLTEFEAALAKFGLESTEINSGLGQAILQSVRGTASLKGKFVPASPLTPALSLMQNSVGLQGKKNPPDLAEILETMYDLGSGSTSGRSLASSLADAQKLRLDQDPILRAIDSALSEVVWGAVSRDQGAANRTLKGQSLAPFLTESPFFWFAQSWDQITSPEWVEALPARVWVDWATTILRAAYALGFLWETTWYEALAREILSCNDEKKLTIEGILSRQEPPLSWRANNASAEIRDLSSKLKWRCFRSVEIRKALDTWITANSAGSLPLEQVGDLMRSDEKLIKKLVSSLNMDRNSDSGPGKNLWEAIRYTLVSREAGDHYGFFKSSGKRYLFAEPGLEWAAVMASLVSSRPGDTTNVGLVADALAKMGASPDPKDLIVLLEKSGLARGAADADLGVQVETAYRGKN